MPRRPLRILITGASTGIGLALARRLLDTDHRLVLTARSSSLARFETEGIAESESVRLRALDVTRREERHAVVDETLRDWGAIDVLVNNAGLAYRSVVEHVDEADRLAQMDVNFLAPLGLARLVLPAMRDQRFGRILNVSSVGGMMAMPTMGMYSASKWALEGATEALWYEVRPWNIRVSLIEPGFVNSDGFEHTRFTRMSQASLDAARDPYHNHYEHMGGFIAKCSRLTRATSESVACTIVRTIHRRRPPLRVPATLDARAFFYLRRVLPRKLYHRVLYSSLPKVRTWGDGPR